MQQAKAVAARELGNRARCVGEMHRRAFGERQSNACQVWGSGLTRVCSGNG